MAEEDFGTYTEVDPNSRITVTTRRVTWTALAQNEDAYVYKDKGIDFFSGDFAHHMTVHTSAVSGTARNGYWALTNILDDLTGIDTANGSYLALRLEYTTPTLSFRLSEVDSGTYRESGSITISLNTTYYLTVERDESVGTYGTLYLSIFSDAAKTTQVGATRSIALNTSKKDFRYVHAGITFNNGNSNSATGYTENLELLGATDPGVLPIVTAQPLTDITSTTATGNGTIVDLGISAVTAHGYVWDTTIDPTTADSKTDEGAGSLGVFTSSITGLLAGQEYYARPYATNGAGTSYGANVYFIAGQPGTLRIKGEFAVVKKEFQRGHT